MAWEPDKTGKFTSVMPLKNIPDVKKIQSGYHTYLTKWQSLVHPIAFQINHFQIHAEQDILKASLILENTDNFKPAEHILSSLVPLEKIFILNQTADLVFLINSFHREWRIDNLYIHPAGCCKWMPMPPDVWLKQTENPLKNLMLFAFMLSGIKIPSSEADWRELETDKKLPWEWIIFLKHFYTGDEKELYPDFPGLFRFIFFQSWFYSLIVQFAMKDNIITPPDFEMIKDIREFFGIRKDQAEAIEMLALKSEHFLSDIEFAKKGNLPTTLYKKPVKTASDDDNDSVLFFHPNRPCMIADEHVGREDILLYIYARLSTDDIQSSAIIGFHKEGKTSFLNYIRQKSVIKKHLGKEADKYSFLYIDLKTGNINTPEEFFKEFYYQIKQIFHIELHGLWENLLRINDYLEKNNRRLVVILDNFNYIILNKNFPIPFYEGLRSWFSQNSQVGCIISSPLQLKDLTAPIEGVMGSPFFNIFDSYSLYPLNYSEAEQLIRKRFPRKMKEYEKDIITLIENFGFSPYPLHVAGKIWTDRFNKQDFSIDAVIDEAYQACQDYYEKIFASMKNRQIEYIRNILSPKSRFRAPVDNTLIDLGRIIRLGNEIKISSKQSERFFRERLGLQEKVSVFKKYWKKSKSIFSGA